MTLLLISIRRYSNTRPPPSPADRLFSEAFGVKEVQSIIPLFGIRTPSVFDILSQVAEL
jgi:hypothetical protein